MIAPQPGGSPARLSVAHDLSLRNRCRTGIVDPALRWDPDPSRRPALFARGHGYRAGGAQDVDREYLQALSFVLLDLAEVFQPLQRHGLVIRHPRIS